MRESGLHHTGAATVDCGLAAEPGRGIAKRRSVARAPEMTPQRAVRVLAALGTPRPQSHRGDRFDLQEEIGIGEPTQDA